jgi:hypothetical protein
MSRTPSGRWVSTDCGGAVLAVGFRFERRWGMTCGSRAAVNGASLAQLARGSVVQWAHGD